MKLAAVGGLIAIHKHWSWLLLFWQMRLIAGVSPLRFYDLDPAEQWCR